MGRGRGFGRSDRHDRAVAVRQGQRLPELNPLHARIDLAHLPGNLRRRSISARCRHRDRSERSLQSLPLTHPSGQPASPLGTPSLRGFRARIGRETPLLRIGPFESTISRSDLQSGTPRGDQVMRHHTRKSIKFNLAACAGLCVVALAAAAFAAEYRMTVNRDRLVNAQKEPQNWLLMNGDYGATRYSKLTQF